MKNLSMFDWIILVLLIIGGINWGLIGAFDTDIVSSIFGEMTAISRTVYSVVGISALYTVYLLVLKMPE